MILNALTFGRAATASLIVDKHIESNPLVLESYGVHGLKKYRDDAEYHLSFLAEAWIANDPALFSAYAHWAAVVSESRKIPKKHLVVNFYTTEDVLSRNATREDRARLRAIMQPAIEELGEAAQFSSYLVGEAGIDILAREYLEMLLRTDRNAARELVFHALSKGVSVRDIYLDVFQRTQYEVGRLWQTNAINVAQEHFCTAATQMIMAQMYDHLPREPSRGKTVVAICVSGELHDLGLRMVCDFLEMDGWDTVFCGANTPAPDIVRVLEAERACVLAISATMTFHLSRVKDIVRAVKASEVGTKLLVGGGPFRTAPGLWKRIGADAFADSAAEATAEVARLAS